MQRLILFLSLFLCYTFTLTAQLQLSVRIDSAALSTSCTDFFSGPDILYQVEVEGTGVTTYDPAEDPCYTAAPNTQYQVPVDGVCNLPPTVNVCFSVLENDGIIIPCAIFPTCFEQICVDIDVPTGAQSIQDTISLTGGASEGALYLTIEVMEDNMDFNYVCGAVDLGTMDYGQTVGDSTAGLYNNQCADNLNEINPVDQGNSLFNNAGVWFTYTTGNEVSPLQVVRVLSDPENTGDFIDAEILVYRSDSCTGTLQRFPLFIVDYSGRDAEIRLLCPTPNTTYYVLVDGAGDVVNQRGVFSITAYDPGLPAGADLKCDADDLGVVPEGGTTSSPTAVGNFCAGFSGDPFVQNFISRNSVWFTFRAPSSGHILVEGFSSSIDEIDLELALYRSDSDTCNTFFRHMYSGRDASSFDESFTFTCLDPGRQYWILADGAGQESVGFFDLSITDLGDIRPVTMQTDTVCSDGSIMVGSIVHDSTGIYIDTLKIGNTNCDSIVITDLTVLPALELNVVQTFPAIGAGGMDGQATATFSGGSGNYTLTWCDGSTAPMNNNLVAGTNCCVTLTDDQGCMTDTCFIVDFVEPFAPFSSFTEPLCTGDSTGSFTFGIRGGRAPYVYFWENADQSLGGNSVFLAEGDSLIVDQIPAGDYTIRIADVFFDTSFVLTVTEPPLLTISVDQINQITCFQACDGSFSVSSAGGTGTRTITTEPPAGGMGCAGMYRFVVTDDNGCTAETTATLIEPAEFIVSAATVQQVSCFGGADGSITLTSNGNPQAYAWSHGPITQTVTNLMAGTYTVTVTNADGCQDTISQVIDQPLAPLQVSFMELNPITCAADADGVLRVDVTGGFGNLDISWSDGQNGPLANDLGPGRYEVTIIDERGCSTTDAYVLNAPPVLSAVTQVRNLRCPDPANAGEISVPTVTGGVGPYLYSIDGVTFGMDSLFTGLVVGNYNVVVQDALGCEFQVPTVVSPPPVLVADLGRDRQILLGDSLLVQLNTNSTDLIYTWSFDPFLQGTDVWVRPQSNQIISVMVFDTLTECTASASFSLLVDRQPRVYVPTAFSPNGDGVNDVFFPYGGTDVVEVADFRIYGRYGNLVYEAANNFMANNPNMGWDGTVFGREADMGVYVYAARVRFFDGREEIVKGEVTLVR